MSRRLYDYRRLDLAELARLHQQGVAVTALCAEWGIPDPHKVRALLRRSGYGVRGRSEAQRARWERVRDGGARPNACSTCRTGGNPAKITGRSYTSLYSTITYWLNP
jgi:hypothetical protein